MDDWNSYDPYEVLNAHNEALHEHGRLFDEIKAVVNNNAQQMEHVCEQMLIYHDVIVTLSEEVAHLKRQLNER